MVVNMPSYRDTLRYLYSIEKFGIKPGLRRIEALLRALGNPHREYPSVLVGGTNGKGSTAAILASVANKAGLKAGLYTSPHLIRFNERIKAGESEITDREVVRLADMVRSAMEHRKECDRASFFEVTTAMAFQYFREKRVDLAVLEVGMGGSLDATNVVVPLVSIITNIGLDHQRFLGTNMEEIAIEKAGIIKESSPVVTCVEEGRMARLIEDIARRRGTKLYLFGRDFRVEPSGSFFDYQGNKRSFKRVSLNLKGQHQYKNASCAIMALELLEERGFSISDSAVRNGLSKVRWPGRFEIVRKDPTVVLDCAHNPSGSEALSRALTEHSFERLFLVLGIMADKDIAGIASRLLPLAHTVIVTRPRTERAASAERLIENMRNCPKRTIIRKTVGWALRTALKEAAVGDAICVTGSVFTVGEARRYLLKDIPKRRLHHG
jgi:dihydrofolate synthase/folylpolyglutamate synthase